MSISLQLVLYLCSSSPNSPADASALQQVLQLFSWCCNAAVGVATLHLSKWCCLTLAGAALSAAGAASAAGATSLKLVLHLDSLCCTSASCAAHLQLVLQPCS